MLQIIGNFFNIEKAEPKFIYLSYNAPHVPVSAPTFLMEQMREEYRNKTPDNGDFWREKMAALEHSGDDSDVTGSADEGSTSGSSEDEDKGPFTDEFLTYHAAIRAIDMARIQI